MGLKVIGAGFGRTGTESMKLALELLGFGPCYHMREVLTADRVDFWRNAAAGFPPDWDAAFSEYRSTVDWPAALFWRELSDHFPDAKILLTIRGSEGWYASMEKTILKMLREAPDPTLVADPLIAGRVFGRKIHDKDHIIATYEQNTADVQAAFGKDRLLTFELGEGWDRLCNFLGCPVPDTPFPQSNKAEDFHETKARFDRIRKGEEPA